MFEEQFFYWFHHHTLISVKLTESMFQTFLLVAYLAIALLSMTIASYTISVSYLGRETRRAKWLIEKRKKKLSRELKELRKEIDVTEIKQKINEYSNEESMLGRKLFFLSFGGAVSIPSFCFLGALLFAMIGLHYPVEDSLYLPLGMSILLMGAGLAYLLVTLKMVEWAASRIPVPRFEVLFESAVTKETFRCKERKKLNFWIKNIGELLAEDLTIFIFFPPNFGLPRKIEAETMKIVKQVSFGDFPDYNALIISHDKIHVDEYILFECISVEMPKKKGTYTVPVRIHERNIGVSEHKLTFEILS